MKPIPVIKKPEKKKGRPSDLTRKIADEIAERLSSGQTMRSICSLDHMPCVSTLYRWEKENDDFRELSTRTREIGTHCLADQCLEIADNPSLDPQDKRVRIDTRLRLIGKWNAKGYGDRIQQDLAVSVKDPLTILIDQIRNKRATA